MFDNLDLPQRALRLPARADLRAFRGDLDAATKAANAFGSAMTDALEGAILKGRSFSDVLKSMAMRLSSMAIGAAMKPLENLISGGVQRLLGGALPFAQGGVLPQGVKPFAKGGVVAAPTYFPIGGGTGLMGEAGPEAIMPLSRGPDGRLGIAANGPGAANVTVNISTPDATSFLKAEGQVATALARAVARGQRNL